MLFSGQIKSCQRSCVPENWGTLQGVSWESVPRLQLIVDLEASDETLTVQYSVLFGKIKLHFTVSVEMGRKQSGRGVRKRL